MTAHPSPTGSLLRRAGRASRLDRPFYRKVQADPSATLQAVAVVVLVALAHAAGGMLRATSSGDPPWTGGLFGLVAELTFFLAASAAIHATARVASDAKVPFDAMLRAFGFATTPGLLILVASAVSLLGVGAEAPALLLVLAWRLAAGFTAVQQTFDTGIGRSAVILAAGVAAGLVAVVAASSALFALLG